MTNGAVPSVAENPEAIINGSLTGSDISERCDRKAGTQNPHRSQVELYSQGYERV